MSDDGALIDRLKKVLIHLQEVDAYLARHEKPAMISWPARRAAMAEAVRAVLKLYLTDETGQVLQIDGKPLPESKALKLSSPVQN